MKKIIKNVGENNTIGDTKAIEYTAEVISWKYAEIDEADRKVIISDESKLKELYERYNVYGDLVEWSESYFSNYDEKFFESKSLAIEYVTLSSSNQSIDLKKATKEGNSVKIEYDIKSIGDVGATVMMADLIVVEVDKDVTNII